MYFLQQGLSSLIKRIALLILIFIFTACEERDSEETPIPPSPTPFGVLMIHINDFGRVEFETSDGFSTPTPLTDAAQSENRLTLRVNGQDFQYDLGRQGFEIQFEADGFIAVNGRKSGSNYFLEAIALTPEPTADPECPNAPPTAFEIGETIQVDFNSVGALQIREAPYSETIIRQVYDNAQLSLLDGPLCDNDRWVWKVYHAPSDVTGWASEGIFGDAWMCPLENPECGN